MPQSQNPAKRRYQTTVLMQMVAYAALLLLANRLVPQAGSGALKFLFAVLPAFPVIGVFIAMGRHVATLADEYQRVLLVRQMLIASALLLSLATVWGFAEDFGVVRHVPAYYAAIVWFGGMGLGGCINRWREGRGEGA